MSSEVDHYHSPNADATLATTYRPSSASTQDQIQVDAYGQMCSVDKSCKASLQALTFSVQSQLQMHQQPILVHDVEGNVVQTDADLEQACNAGRMPLQALLSDTAIHDLEVKRDEITKMQWRVVREQFTAVNKAINSMNGQMTDLKGIINQQKIEIQLLEERCRAEALGMITNEKAERNDDIKKTSSRVEELARAIAAEQSARELVTMQQKQQIDSLKIALEGAKEKAEQDVNKVREGLDNVKQGLSSEVRTLEYVFTNKITELKQEVNCDELGKQIREETHQRELMQKGILEKLSVSATGLEKQLQNSNIEQQNFKQDMGDRVERISETYSSFYKRMSTFMESMKEETQRGNKRFESLETGLESRAMDHSKTQAGINQTIEKVCSFAESIKQIEDHCKAMIDQEQLARTNQNRTLWNAISLYTMEAKAQPGMTTAALPTSRDRSPAANAGSRGGSSTRSHTRSGSVSAVPMSPRRKDDVASTTTTKSSVPMGKVPASDLSQKSSSTTTIGPVNITGYARPITQIHGTQSVPIPQPAILPTTTPRGSPMQPRQYQYGTNLQSRQASRSPGRDRQLTYGMTLLSNTTRTGSTPSL
eukprot:gnl/MRDRNA2_/MRDRNA2_110243_c0_seq1.p1 gnl/MRDRNA2_/MRDRNA2_110243_c0~~gnl/MRDRNA2_/MRDRNA2_110243_c0_seq1.p1  ORF type:complete len:594 (+),score=113.69 gnl/MRDRNA2_/MRDRNA2_110243_c0_seq1:86-1867(+)